MDHGEVFTNEREVNAMLDMVASECERNAFLAVSSPYSVGLLADNTAACRRRLFSFSSSRSRCCSGVLLPAALLDPVSLILVIQPLTVERPKSYSDMIFETGLPAL